MKAPHYVITGTPKPTITAPGPRMLHYVSKCAGYGIVHSVPRTNFGIAIYRWSSSTMHYNGPPTATYDEMAVGEW